ncbi:hypothetical protein SCLCIDRAFT_20945 [Scleroderma citrinum Foug A]|uniref:Uncharacterized protein n=1 Tax=Scleroderma citrinum Foug A TaxID=1036808 RepID=A0A0C3EGK0_9AGAM|nr:hypothetical protein SCLCIDRAFT_20945 [Scleroderma citrinum Foug A]
MPIALGKFIPIDPPTFNKGINYSSTYFGLNFPAAWVIVLDACVKLRNIIHTSIGTGKLYDAFNSYATQFLSELEVLSGGIGQPIEKGTFPSRVMASLILVNRNHVQYDWVHRIYDNYRTESPETERSSYKRSMKDHAITLVANPKKSSLGGFALNDQDTTSEQLRARITAILGIQTYDESVTSIDFTRDVETRKPFRHPAILSMIANRLIWTRKGSSMPIIDLFPEQYMTIPDILVSSSCAYIVCALRALFPGSSGAFHMNMNLKEERAQTQLLKHFRESSRAEVVDFNLWLSTREGAGGWKANLEHVIDAANKQKGPQSK